LSFVVLSGDVTEYGSREQFRLAKELLDGLRIPCHVLPGNHDTKWSESGATDFGRLWGEDRFVFEHGGYRFIGMHQGPLMKMGDGHWAPQDVRWLEQTLKKLPDPNQPIIFITHYPVDDGIANWYVVLDLLKKYNTQVILCGHGHANRDLVFEGVPGVMGRSNLRVRAPGGRVQPGRSQGRQADRLPNGLLARRRSPRGPRSSCGNTITPATPTVTRARISRSTRAIPASRCSGPTRPATPSPAPRRSGGTWRLWAMPRGQVYGLGFKSGTVQWKFKSHNAVYSTPDVSGEVVVFASTDGDVYALKAASGEEVWRFTDEPAHRRVAAHRWRARYISVRAKAYSAPWIWRPASSGGSSTA
jgi:predicted phosphodiesterase